VSAIRLPEGLVASLAHPGGNITGLSAFTPELIGKRLELLKQAVPGISLIAFLLKPDAGVSMEAGLKEAEVETGSARPSSRKYHPACCRRRRSSARTPRSYQSAVLRDPW